MRHLLAVALISVVSLLAEAVPPGKANHDVPEPATLAMIGVGLIVLGTIGRRKR